MASEYQSEIDAVIHGKGKVRKFPDKITAQYLLSRELLFAAAQLALQALAEAEDFLEATDLDKNDEPFDHVSPAIEGEFAEFMFLRGAIERVNRILIDPDRTYFNQTLADQVSNFVTSVINP